MNKLNYMQYSSGGVAIVYRTMAVALVALLTLPAPVAAQDTPAVVPPTAAIPMTQNLRILPLTAPNSVNDLERLVMSPLAVQILDQNDLPVEGATVIFRFPLNGPSAMFAGQQTGQTVRTGANGQARATAWTANNQVGSFAVQITATRGSEMGVASIVMTNVARVIPESERPRKHWWTSKWAKIAYVAAAAAITTGIVLHNGDSTLRGGPGVPVIGGPQ